MGWFSTLRKNKQESTSDDSAFYSRAEEESKAVRGKARRSRQDKQSSAPVDPILPEKKRARRRLMGAVALVLAAVIGLPMILDSEPKPLADDIAIQIPSRDKPVASSSQPSSVSALSRVAASAALDQKEELVTTPSAAANGSEVPLPAVADTAKDKSEKVSAHRIPTDAVNTVSQPQPANTRNIRPKPEDKSGSDIRSEPAASPSTEKHADAARARAILEGKADISLASAKTAMDKKPARFTVQVAALASREKIDALQGKLKKAGISSYTQKVATETGDRTRIRIGPFGSKEEADKMRARLVKLGLSGTLVPLDS